MHLQTANKPSKENREISVSTKKTSLFLMELIVVILFFSICAAVCAQLFTRSHLMSKESGRLQHALLLAQNMEEGLDAMAMDPAKTASLYENARLQTSQGRTEIQVFFDGSFREIPSAEPPATTSPAYVLSAVIEKVPAASLYPGADQDALAAKASISVKDYEEENIIYSMQTDQYLGKERKVVHE